MWSVWTTTLLYVIPMKGEWHKKGRQTGLTLISKKLVLALLKPYKTYIVDNDITITEGSILSRISAAKAKGLFASDVLRQVNDKERSKRPTSTKGNVPSENYKSFDRILAEIYIGYEEVLKNNNALDFDDLLIYGVKLFGTHEQAVLWCRHVLVDELYVLYA